MRGTFLAAGLLNIAALSALFISNLGWKCEKGYFEAAHKYMTDAPIEVEGHARNYDDDNDDLAPPIIPPTNDNNDDDDDDDTDNLDYEPSYLKWDASPVEVPPDWSFQAPRNCKNITHFHKNDRYSSEQKVIVHYHMQHNAGTSFFSFAQRFTPCATRACWQDAKHCMVSNNEQVEAENLRQNYKEHGVQYVSYELMLPPRFPLPFVSETAREGLFFTTIVRDPFKRFLTYVRRHKFEDRGLGPDSPFWKETHGAQGPYAGDNLNARWLSGATEHQIDSDHVNIAKCRLQLFDLVIADKLMDHAIKKVMCPLNGWRGMGLCQGEVEKREHASKPDPLNGTDPLIIGAWIERLRPSFEIYDYARILSWKQLRQRGITDLPELSDVPSYMDTLAKFANITLSNAYFKKLKRVTLENEEYFGPPVEFCDMMKRVWTNNPDEIPNAFGIGTIKNGFHPRMLKPAAKNSTL